LEIEKETIKEFDHVEKGSEVKWEIDGVRGVFREVLSMRLTRFKFKYITEARVFILLKLSDHT
jgi:hypothetical protein